MNELKCGACLFRDICTPKYDCDHYFPADDPAEDEFIDTYIEEQRDVFYDEWWRYTAEWN